MADGNSQEELPESTIPATHHIMAPLAGGFDVMITTTDVKAGMGNVTPVVLTANDGPTVFAEHHLIGILPVTMPVQDVPEGETQAKP
jgi:hypothetical protein